MYGQKREHIHILGSVMSEVMARLSRVDSLPSRHGDPESMERLSRASRVPAPKREPKEFPEAETKLRELQVHHH